MQNPSPNYNIIRLTLATELLEISFWSFSKNYSMMVKITLIAKVGAISALNATIWLPSIGNQRRFDTTFRGFE